MPSSLYNAGQLYLSIDSRHITNELLQAFAKKNVFFDGSVTIVDSYNKVPTRTVTFGQASMVSYSDQVSSGYYGDSFGAASISISCKTMSINNIVIEQ
ncbi:MAG: hypothetical protein EOP49_10705 [Sphingobacteriales bacterium]|nr:MAG: hypothetical protein EOP49_10705 [Sphingobacteriales bacterium]